MNMQILRDHWMVTYVAGLKKKKEIERLTPEYEALAYF